MRLMKVIPSQSTIVYVSGARREKPYSEPRASNLNLAELELVFENDCELFYTVVPNFQIRVSLKARFFLAYLLQGGTPFFFGVLD